MERLFTVIAMIMALIAVCISNTAHQKASSAIRWATEAYDETRTPQAPHHHVVPLE